MIFGHTDSGMQYAVRRGWSQVAYCALSIKCGTRSEGHFHNGIAHFAEHTVFKGTDKRSASAISSCLDKLGGELNAYTTKEEIVIHATVLKEDLKKAVSLLMDLAVFPSFPENEIETEKGVVIDEIKSYKDSPSEEIYDRFEELLFKGHPLSLPILGTAASVRKISSGELRAFVKEKFVPEMMALTIVADIEEKRMAEIVSRTAEKYFGRISGGAVPVAGCFQKQDVANPPFEIQVAKRNHQVNCIVGTTAPSLYDEEDRIATILLCNIVGGPASNSILNAVLREKHGWVYGVECNYTQYSDTGIVAISLGCDRDNMDKCFKAMDRELLRLQENCLSGRKLAAAKRQLLGQLAISSDNGEAQCLSMGKGLISYGKIMADSEVRDKIESVTADKINEMAGRLFCRSGLSKLVYL